MPLRKVNYVPDFGDENERAVAMAQLPPGFVIDKGYATLPPGFVIDPPSQWMPPPTDPIISEQWMPPATDPIIGTPKDPYDAFLNGEIDEVDLFLKTGNEAVLGKPKSTKPRFNGIPVKSGGRFGGTLTPVDYEPEFDDAPGTSAQPTGNTTAQAEPGPGAPPAAFGGPMGVTPPGLGTIEEVNKAFLKNTGAQFIYDNMPAIAATVATLPMGGPGVFARGLPAAINALRSAGVAAAAGGTAGGMRAAAEGGDVLSGVANAATEQGLADLAGSAILKGMQKVASPVGRAIGEQGQRAAKFAVEKGLPANPAELFPNWLTRSVNEMLDAFGPSSIGLAKKRDVISKALTVTPDRANQLILDVAQVYGRNAPENTSAKVAQGVVDALERIHPPKNSAGVERALSLADEAYGKFFDVLGDGATDFPVLRRTMDDILEAESKAAIPDEEAISFITQLKKRFGLFERVDGELVDAVERKTMTGRDLHKMMQRLSRVGADARNTGRLRDAIRAEFETLATNAGRSGEAKAALDNANMVWALGDQFASHPLVKKIANGISETELTPQLFRNSNIPLLKQMKHRLPKEDFESLLTLNLENMINNAATGQKGDAVRIVNGDLLRSRINANREVLEKFYPQESLDAFENFAIYASIHKPGGVGKVLPGQEAAERARSMIRPTVTGAIGIGSVASGGLATAGLVAGSIASYGIAKGIMNTDNVLHKWLTTGLVGTGPEGWGSFLLRTPLRFAAEGESQ